jgi:type I restriction enzyme, S subunit
VHLRCRATHLSFDQLRSAPIALPPLGEQLEIVTRVDRLLAVADDLQNRIDTAAGRVERSSQAILAKAFRGDLVA